MPLKQFNLVLNALTNRYQHIPVSYDQILQGLGLVQAAKKQTPENQLPLTKCFEIK